MRFPIAVLHICMLAVATPIASASASTQSAAVDQLFERWDHPDTPGMTVAILRDGVPLYVRGYGMASVELGDPNGPNIVYPLASNSKQFTAFAVQLLAAEGRLSLADDVRKFVPELHDFGTPITLDMLIHHTSGLREVVSLLDLEGHAPEDAASREHALDILVRQRALNFVPGSHYIYSNSNYLLLGYVVERVSGISLAEFWRRYIFQPLGMGSTSSSGQPMPIIPHRAYGYGRGTDGRYVPRTTPDALLGPTGVNSTVGDLAKWLANYDDPKIGGRAVVDAMLKPGTLSDGTPITYASGLHREHYRGLEFIEHSGVNWGYKTDIIRFPAQHFSVIILANADDSEPPQLALQIADIYLKDQFPSGKPRPSPITMPVAVDRYVGTYEVAAGTTLAAPGRQYTFRKEDFVGDGATLIAFSDADFFRKADGFRVHFTVEPGEGSAERAIIHDPSGDDFVARRVIASPALLPPDRSSFASLAGFYWSRELNIMYTIDFRDGKLWLRYPRGEMELSPLFRDVFEWRHLFTDHLTFIRDPRGTVTGFFLTENNQRVTDLKFMKVEFDQ